LIKILISGFTTFSSHAENSSEIIAKLFKSTPIKGFETQVVILPVTFSESFKTLNKAMNDFLPDYVLCLGLGSNRKAINLEKVAINLIHSDIADNEGVLHQDQWILKDGPSAYFATLPLEEMRKLQTPFPVEMSFTAGTYVCNYVMYESLNFLKDSKVKAGFIHLPHLEKNKDKIFDSLVIMLQTFSI
jgi:pyroglutamyl-peptidase